MRNKTYKRNQSRSKRSRSTQRSRSKRISKRGGSKRGGSKSISHKYTYNNDGRLSSGDPNLLKSVLINETKRAEAARKAEEEARKAERKTARKAARKAAEEAARKAAEEAARKAAEEAAAAKEAAIMINMKKAVRETNERMKKAQAELNS